MLPHLPSGPDHSYLPSTMLLERKPDQGTLLVKLLLSLTHPCLHHKSSRPSPGIRASVTSSLPYWHNKSTQQLQAPCSFLPPKAALLHLLNGTVFHPFRPSKRFSSDVTSTLKTSLTSKARLGHTLCPLIHTLTVHSPYHLQHST